MVKDNNLLLEFKLVGIAPAPKGVPQIKVSIQIDQNGDISIDATDIGKSKS